ncbi:MAG: efflux transporter periplasmic adaptor subunit [Rhodobacterales bacterium]|nr:MAG: efflux transporter periplasmic adaptor subunit [Rhodobacterales bacterium]
MRIMSILTAIIVAAGLFFLVFQRDTFLRFAGLTPEEAAPVEAVLEEAPAGAVTEDGRVAVVVIDSVATEIDSAVITRGRTEAAREVQLAAETSGKVISAPIPRGTLISKGDLMCEIDMGTRAATLAQAKAGLTEAEANAPVAAARVSEAEARLEEARINLEAAEGLAKGGFATDTRVANARAGMASAQAAVSSAKAGLASAQAAAERAQAQVLSVERDIANTRIYAPFDGVLESDTAETGALLQPGAPCARILALDPIRLVGFVAETDVDRIQVGSLVGAQLSSGRQVRGAVSFLSRSADATTRTFRVEAEIANPDLSIRAGQTAEILIASTGKRAHLVPQSSLTLSDTGQLGVRIVNAEGKAVFAPVSMERDTLEGVWVSGLPEKITLIVIGQDYVKEGVAVAAVYREATQ